MPDRRRLLIKLSAKLRVVGREREKEKAREKERRRFLGAGQKRKTSEGKQGVVCR